MSLPIKKSIVRSIAGLIFSGALALSCSSKDEQTSISPAPAAAPGADSAAEPAVPQSSAQGLNLDPSTSPDHLSGSYRSGETVLAFDSYRSGDDIRFKLSRADGTPLVDFRNRGTNYEVSFGRPAFTLTADAHAVREAAARRGHEEQIGVPRHLP